MKTIQLFWVAVALLLAACNPASPPATASTFQRSTRPATVKLVHHRGMVTLRVPRTYDTLLTWVDESDCSLCGKQKYRLQSKYLPISEETGFLYKRTPTDSIEQLTIAHDELPVADHTLSVNIVRLHESSKLSFEERLGKSPYRDTIEKINGRYFSIFESSLYDSASRQYRNSVTGTTAVKADIISFRYELLSRRQDSLTANFLRDSRRLLRTIQIQKEP